MRDLIDALALPARSFVVAFIGACLASGWFKHARAIAVVVVAASIVVGLLCDHFGSKLLPHRPYAAIRWLEGWLLVPIAVGALGAALIVILTVNLAAPESASSRDKELAKAATAAIASFVTSVMIARENDKTESPLARRIRRTFWRHYNRGPGTGNPRVKLFAKSSVGENWVYSNEFGGIEGWGYAQRRTRAQGIETELKSGSSDFFEEKEEPSQVVAEAETTHAGSASVQEYLLPVQPATTFRIVVSVQSTT